MNYEEEFSSSNAWINDDYSNDRLRWMRCRERGIYRRKIVSVEVEILDGPTEEVETEVVEEVAEEPTEVAEEPAEEETPVEETSPYSYTELNQVMYAQSTVNVRDLPEQTGGKVGSLTANQEVTVTGQCNETGWYRISYNGSEGFVSNSYLGTEKVAVKSSSSGTASSGASTPAESTASAPASEPAEEPAVSVEESNSNQLDASNAVTIDRPIAPGETLMPEHWYCGWCNDGVDYGSAEAFDAHARDVHGVY